MAIRYDASLNAKLRREVKNFNEKRNLMEKRGFKNLPPTQKVSELKARYSVRNDLTRELQRLKNFSRGSILKKIETEGGAKSTQWEFQYLKGNKINAREYFQREYERVAKRSYKYPGERMYLDNIQAKIDLLNKDINYLSQSEFRSFKATISEFTNMPANRKAQYRGFLNEVEVVMDLTGVSKEQKDKFFNKFSKLTPSQFIYAYDNNDIIAKIYSLYHKSEDGEPTLTDTEENAKGLVDELMEQADSIVADAKANSE